MINLYYSNVAINEIKEKTGISYSTLYRYLKSQELPLRARTDRQSQASITNVKKASLKKQIKIENITLNKIYNSKKEALIDMIESGYSSATNWHNIRAPLDKALAKKQKTFLNFEWRYIDD